MTHKFRQAGWELSVVLCYGHGRSASAGVALAVREGFPIAPATFDMVGVRLPFGPRMRFWRASNLFIGNFIIVVLYLISWEIPKLSEGNLALLDSVAAALNTLGMPFVIMADWNMSPVELKAAPFLRTIGGIVASPGSPTCFASAMGPTEIDFMVYSPFSFAWAYS